MKKNTKIRKRTWSNITYKAPVKREIENVRQRKRANETPGLTKNSLSFVVPWQLTNNMDLG